MVRCWILLIGPWTPLLRCWILLIGPWILLVRCWILLIGPWTGVQKYLLSISSVDPWRTHHRKLLMEVTHAQFMHTCAIMLNVHCLQIIVCCGHTVEEGLYRREGKGRRCFLGDKMVFNSLSWQLFCTWTIFKNTNRLLCTRTS